MMVPGLYPSPERGESLIGDDASHGGELMRGSRGQGQREERCLRQGNHIIILRDEKSANTRSHRDIAVCVTVLWGGIV